MTPLSYHSSNLSLITLEAMRLLVLISEKKKTIIQENSIPPSLDGPIAHVYMGNFHLAEVGSGKIK